ncbi:cell wall proline rich protein [Akanthomyces lecanii RCEF 1005]|uniref:Cell wall proline rich protein n=1 Tax=Akanthomyces lecanii RCEF 1005 TaxID=1081108 RepID=A0A162K7Y3_CORDF|nr:cell wall proline rich protein [Akanthomyces lecanii RCEF 1005]
MAATLGPAMGRNESSPTLQPLTYDARQDTLSTASSRRDAPVAIPDFVFPAQPASSEELIPELAEQPSPASLSHEEFRFPVHDNRPHRPAALPDFSFNPGASMPTSINSPVLLSPPTSPHSPNPTPSPSRPVRHGHRRGGSEFVGGSIRDGSSIAVMSTSPTKDAGFPQSLQPPPPRRGHRRGMSGAISTNDLPILHPPAMDWTFKGSSAPNSPTNFDRGINATMPLADDPQNLAALPEPVQKPPTPTRSAEQPAVSMPPSPKPTKTTARARVGFSDTLEFIPRPLSLVSSDTSSTVTARPGHCMSESISSVVSPTSVSDDYSPVPLSRSPTKDTRESRPSTAGAILESFASTLPEQMNTSPRRRNSIPALIGVGEPASVGPALPSPTRTPKRWSFFGPSSTSTRSRPISSSSSDSASRTHTVSSSDRGSDSETAEPSKSKQEKKKSKKSRAQTVKGWAGSILPIKSKGDKRRSKPGAVRPPTPPPSVTPMDEDEDDEEEDAAQDAAPAPPVRVQPPELPTLVTQQPRRPDEIMSPMIDLDAALGPFNTPLPHNPEWEAAQRAAGSAGRRRLHSAQGMKGFVGPGMHYHRRAESAPDLPPFDAGRAIINRFGSNSTMADVFEEEEEEDEDEGSDGGNTTGASEMCSKSETKAETIIFSDSGSETTSLRGLAVRRKSSGLSDKDHIGARSVRAECSRTSLHESVIVEEPSSSKPVLPSPVVLPSRRDSWDSGAPSPKRILHMPTNEPLPVDAVPLTLPQGASMPLSPYSMSTVSSHPSPRSPMSDAQRVSTAPSSVAEDNSFRSLLMGEPGPEVRISKDYDIPSLTSSTSTMTRESGFHSQARPQPSVLRDQRPVSVSSAAFGRRRSSLISLSRLISSSHGERSKLSTELTFEEAESRAARSSKTKKLGRMMQFWKPNKPGPST